jgi:hypothetical protein
MDTEQDQVGTEAMIHLGSFVWVLRLADHRYQRVMLKDADEASTFYWERLRYQYTDSHA